MHSTKQFEGEEPTNSGIRKVCMLLIDDLLYTDGLSGSRGLGRPHPITVQDEIKRACGQNRCAMSKRQCTGEMPLGKMKRHFGENS